ncbi:MAG: acetate--CoA ligase family protein [Chloroflexota bacterium]
MAVISGVARRAGTARVLTEIESKELVRQAGITVSEAFLATSEAEATSMARRLGFPLVLKIASADIVHKSDAGGVRLGLNSLREIAAAYREIMAAARSKCPGAAISGVSVQKRELDLNPVFAYRDRALAVDARVVLV